MMIRLKENPDYAALPEIKSGDRVILELAEWTHYQLEAQVTNSNYDDGTYVCKVTDILNKKDGSPFRGSDPVGVMGDNILVERKQIQQKKG